MKKTCRYGLSFVLALGLGACGTNTSSDDAAPAAKWDAAIPPPAPDTAVAPAPDTAVAPTPDTAVAPGIDTATLDPYIWIVIQDTEQKACTTNGPGADIDAVALLSQDGTPIGWGMKGKAKYTGNPGGYACENEYCNGGNCKYAANSKTIPLATLVSYTEGPADARVNATGDDTGYFSLNAGTLQIQMGGLLGEGPARPLYQGDYIAVSEVDKSYVTSGNAPATCICVPEHYTVTLQTASGAELPLKPVTLSTDNTTCSPLTAAPTEGCGSTVFQVP